MARKGNVLKSGNDLWQRHVRIYHGIFLLALEKLPVNELQEKSEPEISAKLNILLLKICEDDSKQNRELSPPTWEQPIHPDDENDNPLKAKRPDFTCRVINPDWKTMNDSYIKDLHIECKRLDAGDKAKSLTERYVTEGIQRFDVSTHRYGCGVDTGFMIGYIVSGKTSDVLRSVNFHLDNKMKAAPLMRDTERSGVTIHKQMLSRKNVTPVEFSLFHFWKEFKVSSLSVS